MADTPPHVERRYRELLMARSGAERVRMGASLHATARALVRASILARRPEASETELRQALSLRFYGDDFSPPGRERILAWLDRTVSETAVRGGRAVAAARKVPVDWGDLEMALTMNAGEWTCYLDATTGEVVMAPVDRPGVGGDWPSPEALDDGVAAGRLLPIEPLGSHVEWGWMAEFVASVPDANLREQLDLALRGRGAFRRFKDTLAGRRTERERWFAFQAARLRAAAQEWLAAQGIEPAP